MKKNLRKVLSVLIALVLFLQCTPFAALAEIIVESSSSVRLIDPDKASIYVTYEFYANAEDTTPVATQIVNQSKGETPSLVPSTPAAGENQEFIGWYYREDGKEYKYATGAETAYTENTTVKVIAKYDTVYYVYFMTVKDANGKRAVHASGKANSANGFMVAAPTDYEPKGARVTGWYLDEAFTTAYDANVAVEKNTYVYPETVACHWVSFDTQGGSSVASAYLDSSETLSLASITATRTGFTFEGWSTTADGLNPVTEVSKPTKDITLYAIWAGAPVEYTIVYWGENADDEDYSVLGVGKGEANAETTVQLMASSAAAALPEDVDLTHFTFEKSDAVKILADESSVVNVYYTRNVYKITFKDVVLTCTNTSRLHWHSDSCYGDFVVEDKFDADISHVWSESPIKEHRDDGTTFTSNDTGKLYAFLEKMPCGVKNPGNLILTKNESSSSLKYWYYYLETLNGSAPNGEDTTTHAGKTYYRYMQSSARGWTSLTYTEDYFPITGFTQKYKGGQDGWSSGSNPSKTISNGMILYYDRVSYGLTKKNYGDENTEQIKYQASIENKGGEPDRPTNFSDKAQFKGWYLVDPANITESTKPFDFKNATMPAKNLVLHAYWAEPDVNVEAIVKISTDAGSYQIVVPRGKTIASTAKYAEVMDIIEASGKTLLKWVNHETGAMINVNAPMTEDMTIRAVFAGDNYSITYDANGGAGDVPTDSHKYEEGAVAKAASGAGLKKGTDVFVYWTDNAGNIIYPGDEVKIGATSVILTANYAPVEETVKITYHTNPVSGSDKTSVATGILNNSEVTLSGFESVFSKSDIPEGYRFAGWATSKNGSVIADNTVRVNDASASNDAPASNDVYAIWEPDLAEYVVHHYLKGTTTPVAADVKDTYTIGETLTASAVTVSGLTADAATKSIEIQLDATKNVITFYYTAALTITAGSAEKVYDGKALTQPRFTAEGLVNGDTADKLVVVMTADSTITNVGTKANEVDVTKVTIPGYYTVTYNPGTLTVTENAAEIVVTTTGGTFTYDGQAHGATVAVSDLPAGYTLAEAKSSASATDVTTADVAATADTLVIKNAAGEDVTSKLNIKYVDGKIKVTPATLTITTPDANKEYDGKALTAEGSISGFVNSETATFTTTGSQTEVGNSENTYSLVWNGTAKESNYTISATTGTLTVTANTDAIVVKANDGEKVYDGVALTQPNATVTGVPEGFTYKVTTKGSITNVGTVANEIDSFVIFDANDKDVTDQFSNITKNSGTLEVTKRAVTFTGESATKTYTGEAQEITGIEDDLLEGFEYAGLTYSAKGTTVGEYDGAFSGEVVIKKGEEDVTSNFEITKNPGALTIVAADTLTVKVTGNVATKVYNGEEQEVTGFTSDAPATVTVELAANAAARAAGTNVGKYSMGLKAEDFVASSENYANIVIEIAKDGELEITPITDEVIVNIAGNTDSRVYDGEMQVLTGYEVTGFSHKLYAKENVALAEGKYAKAEGGSVGEYPMGLTPEHFVNTSANFTNVKFVVVDGLLTITPIAAKITITAASDEKVYDGTALTNAGYTYTEGVLLTKAGDHLVVVVAGTITDVGEVANVVTSYKVMTGERDVTENYTFGEPVDGVLKVTPRSVTLTSATVEKVYDGEPLTNDTVTVTGNGFVEGEGAAYTVTGTQTDVGNSKNTFTYTLNANTKAGNYEIEKVEGTLTVTPVTDKVTVTITENSGSEKYDGTEKSVTGYTVSIDNTLYTEEDFEFKGNDTVKATDAGSYAMELKPADFTNISKNFTNVEFVIKDGTLEIAKRELTMTSADAEKEYDGEPLTNNTVTITGDGFATGEGAAYDVTGTQTLVGSSENAFTYELNEGTKADNYTINKVEGTLTVKDRAEKYAIEVVANSDEYTYDGAAKTVKGFNTLTFVVEGNTYTVEGLSAAVTETNAGEYVVEIKGTEVVRDENGNDVTAQFTVTKTNGSLVINKLALTITADSDSKEYDGTALTKNSYTNTALATGDAIASVTVTGSQTMVGESDNLASAAVIKEGDNDVTANYDITYKPGTLEVTKSTKAIKVVANSNEWNYDGADHADGGYTVTFGDEKYTVEAGESATLSTGDTVTATITKTVKDVADTAAGNNVIDNLVVSNANQYKTIESEAGTLTIKPINATVTIIGKNNTTVYDGEEHTVKGYEVTEISTDLYKEADFTFSGEAVAKRTEVGKTNMGLAAEQFENINGNFATVTFNVTDGYQEITAVDEVVVTITGNSDTKEYNGSEQSVTEYKVEISNPLYTEADFTFSGNAEAKRTDVGTTSMGLAVDQFKNTNENFAKVTFNVTDGSLTITQKPLIITAESDSKEYDGVALTKNSYTNSDLAEGDAIASVAVTGSQTDVGSSENVASAAVIKDGDTDVTANYDITYEVGTLEVTPVDDKVTVTITENSGSEKYDGTEKSVTGYTVSIDNTLYTEEDFEFFGDATITGTDAGTYEMELTADDFENISENFANVVFEIVDGKLEISKRTVTMTSADDEKVYDGKALINAAVAETGDGFVEGEGATYTVTGTQTDVGTSANKFTYTLNEGTKADNYEITTVEGTLEVTPVTDKVTVTITENSGSEKYDGTEKTVTGYTVSIDNTLYTEEDFEFKGDDTVKATDAGSYAMELKPADFTNTSKNFTNVEFVIKDGTLEISKRTVTLTSATDSKVYDGNALTNNEVAVSGDGFATGEGAAYDVTGTQTEVGNSKNTFTYTLNAGTKADNYEIEKVEGTLTVTELTDKVTVTITEHKGSEKYDGTEKTVTGYDVAISNPLYTEADFTFDGNDTVKATDAGTYNMELTAEDFTNISKNFTNVEFVIKDGTLEISKRTVTMTSADDEKVYDGTALTNDTVTVSGDGFAEGEGAAYDVTGTQTEVGSSANAFTYTLNEGTKADNYTITTVEGTLEVTPVTDKVTVTITENSGSEKYDGSEKTVTGYTVSIDNELYTEDDFTFSGDATVKGTDAGIYEMELTAEDFENISKNFTNVEFVIVDGTLEISKRTVTMTSADDEKVYDGTALTNDTVTVSGDGFAEGEGAAYDVTGTQTEVGESKNTFTYTLNEGTKADNYTITTVEGTLEVTPVTDKVTVTITENSGSEKYDGSEKTVTGYTVSIDNELYTEDDFTFSGNDTVKGTDAGSYAMELKPADFTNDSKNFANVEFVIVDGTLEISKRTVTLTSADDEKVYDGTALTNNEVTVGGDGFAEGEGAAYDVTGTQTEVGSSANAFTYTLNEGTKADNYVITTVEGTLTVTKLTDKVTVTITEHKGNEKYDGTEKTVTGYDVAISNPLYTVEDFTFSGEAIVKGTDAGSYNMELKPANFTNISENFSNVEFVIVDGTLVVAKRELTMTSADAEKVYDSTELTNDTVTVSGEGFVEGEGATYDVTGSQTLVGSSKNEFTYTLNEGTKADNYTITKVEGTLTVTVTEDDDLVVNKTHEGEEFGFGETVTFTITVKNIYDAVKTITITEKTGVTLVGGTDGKLVIADVAPGAEVTATATYVITSNDILAGEFVNEVEVSFGDGPTFGDEDPVDPEAVDTTLDVEKTSDKDGKKVELGEKITYTITVTNKGNVPFYNVKVVDELVDLEETIAELKVGETKTFEAAYTVTSADILSGKVVNSVTATADPVKDPDGTEKEPTDTDEITDEPGDLNTTLEVVKTSDVAEGETVSLGDIITYTITVTNKGNVPFYDVVVKDEMVDFEETIAELAVGVTETFTVPYVVTSDDIKAGEIVNAVTAEGEEIPDPKDPDDPKKPEGGDEEEDPTDDVDTTLSVVKKTTSTPAKEAGYALGEAITYEITVKNEGNVPFTNVKVTDKLTGDEWTIETLGVDESKTFNATYTVTSADILVGKVANEVTATANSVKDPDGDDKTPKDDAKVEDPTDDLNTTLEVVKTTTSTPANGETYALNETIKYEITVTNKGNVPFYNVKVVDELTKDSWTIETLAVGESKTYTAEYVVVEADIKAGKVINNATATADPIDDPKKPEDPKPNGGDDVEDPTDKPNPAYKIVKVRTDEPANGEFYELGEEVEFEITVTNTGNVTLKGIVVKEELEGAIFENGTDEMTIETLPPFTKTEGENVVKFTATYVITEDDLGNDDLANTLSAKDSDGNDPDPIKPEPIPVDDVTSVTVTKVWNDLNNKYNTRTAVTVNLLADEVAYTRPDEEAPATAVIAEDEDGNWNSVTFEKLPVHKNGEEIVYTVEEVAVPGYDATYVNEGNSWTITNTLQQYTLTIRHWIHFVDGEIAAPNYERDVYYGESYSVRSPNVKGFWPNPRYTTGIVTGNMVHDVIYDELDFTLTVQYVYQNGATAAPTHVEKKLHYGDDYRVVSPKLEGYVASYPEISGYMGTRDLSFTVIYVPENTVIIEEYGVPLGLGNVEMNVGECFE